ncbi:conserved protein of unknown function [Hyphomicrobium sp. 1Nfss2.1]|uniref:hypothetical protein n=1 Tax=Hyphomicrobium sp. 1Nfss2.1 TaxID=3413936 RepID=UPI003C7C704D
MGVFMSVPARRHEAHSPERYSFDFVRERPENTLGPLDAGEPIYPPRKRGSSMLSASLVLLVLFGGGWAVVNAPGDWLAQVGERAALLMHMLDGRQSGMAEANLAATAPAGTAASPPPAESGAAPMVPTIEPHATIAVDAPVPPDAAPVETASIDEAAPEEEGDPQPLPPPQVDPKDPYQRRAMAAGLHPDLSRALLARLTAADYRNAAYAIDTAIAKTANGAEFVWPRQRKPEQALFRVHFVKGAAVQGCRRYVVTVSKDGWLTTALPMERCSPGGDDKKTSSGVHPRSDVSAR